MACLFEKLDRKKQERIINAALHVFSVNDYKNALTDDIAAKAEISKGSLFQYFKNKLSLYLHLYNFSLEQLSKVIDEQFDFKEKDYFKLVHQSLLLKIALYKEYPYLSQFIIKANEELNPEIAEAIDNINQRKKNNYLGQIFENVDYSKFKEGTDIDDLFKMIEWCGDGIWNEGINSNHSVDRMYQQAIKMIDFFKQAVYKKEYFER